MLDLFTNPNPKLLKTQLWALGPDVLDALLIFIYFCLWYLVLSFLLKIILRKAKFEEALIRIIITLLKVLFLIIGVVIVAKQFGVNVTSALTGIGIIGVGIGFAAQDALSNIVSGFFIFYDKPFRVGDYITYHDQYGRVEQITIRTTRIRTQNNTYVVIPNQKIINELVIDHSTNGKTRLIIHVGIAYKESIAQAREVILAALATQKDILKNPAPDVVVDELADSSVKLQVRVWIANAKDETQVHFDTVELVKNALEQANIEIAFPHLKIITPAK